MCCCGKPTINGEPGYSWDGKTFGVRQVSPPAIIDGDELLHDEPGRCGGIDSHSHHFRIVRNKSWVYLLVRHGAGDERLQLKGCNEKQLLRAIAALDSNGRYWLLQSIQSTVTEAKLFAADVERRKWQRAAAEKRIKTRKQRGIDLVKVWIET